VLTTKCPVPRLTDLDFKPYEADGFRLFQGGDIEDYAWSWEIGLKRWPRPHLTAGLGLRFPDGRPMGEVNVSTQARVDRLTEPLIWGLMIVAGVLAYALAFVVDMLLIPVGMLLGKRFSARAWLNEHSEMP